MSVWSKGRRVARRITWHEIHARLRQGTRKRYEIARYRMGVEAAPTSLPDRSFVAGAFLFSEEGLQQRVALLEKHLSEEVKAIVLEADELCNHRFRLLGYKNLNYGPEIDWHLDAVHQKKSPLKPWYKVPFLNFAAVGDHKITWELNRHQHLVTLAKAWALTRQEQYAAEAIRQWYGWQRANPFPLGINWGSSLEVAFRSLSWLWMWNLLAGCPILPSDFESDLLQALDRNARYIEQYLSTYFSPNTHLLGEAVALFVLGTVFPHAATAARWQTLGWEIVLRESERQVHGDGVYFEQSLYYHVYALDFFLHARTLAAHNQVSIPAAFDESLQKMLEVVRAVSQGGPPDNFGDDDGGRVFNPRRNRSEHLSDPLAVGAVLFGKHEIKSASSLTEESLWLFGDRAVSCFAESPHRLPLQATSFKAGGIYVMASSDRCDQRMVIDAGPMGMGRAGHGHADALSATVAMNGRRWLIDAGSYCYISKYKRNRDRDRFRGTKGHNTLQVDGLHQAVPEGPFAWSGLPNVQAERWLTGSTFSIFAGNHTGYERLPDPVVHRRFIFHLHGSFWLVQDRAEGQRQHRLESAWHFAPDLKVSDVDGAFIAEPKVSETKDNSRLALITTHDFGWKHVLRWDEVAPIYGMKVPAQVLCSRAHIELPAECAILIAPLLDRHKNPGRLTRHREDHGEATGAVHGYKYREAGRIHSMIFSREKSKWNLGAWASDAEFIYCGIQNGSVSHFILCHGSFASFNGKTVFSHERKIERVEWLRGRDSVFSSDSNVHVSLSQDMLFEAS